MTDLFGLGVKREKIKNGEWWTGDCLELVKDIPDGFVDCVVTDPPYRVHSGGNKSNPSLSKTLGGNSGKIFKHNDILFDEWLPEVFRVLKTGSHFYVMTNFKNLFTLQADLIKAGFEIHNLLVWEKNTKNANRWYMKNCEYTLFCRKGLAKTINNASSCTVHKFTNNKPSRFHPTEKPVDLMKFYILNSSEKGNVILDLFGGSGSTAVAAEITGRKWICIERDPEYSRRAIARIENHTVVETLL